MSAIFGILQFNGTPVQNAYLLKMRDKLAPYGQEGADVFHAETAGLGRCLSKFCVVAGRRVTPDCRQDDLQKLG